MYNFLTFVQLDLVLSVDLCCGQGWGIKNHFLRAGFELHYDDRCVYAGLIVDISC